MTERLDAYDLGGACGKVFGFLDALTNWYIRRSRERFWKSGMDDDKRDAYDTLYTALVTLAKTVAPFLPFVSEEIYRGLTGEMSVHLADWPDAATLPADAELVAAMDRVRDAASAARTLREKVSVRVRQPLASMTIAGPGVAKLAPYEALLRDEVNVKAVHLAESIDAWARFQLQVNSRAAGPRLGTAMKSVLAAAKQGRFEELGDGRVRAADQVLEAGEWQLRLDPKPGIVCEPLAASNAIVVLDVHAQRRTRRRGHRARRRARRTAGAQGRGSARLRSHPPRARGPGGVARCGDAVPGLDRRADARAQRRGRRRDRRRVALPSRIATGRREDRDRRRPRGEPPMSDYFAPTMRLYVDELVDWKRYLELLHGSAPDVTAEVGAYRTVLETSAALAQSFERDAREHWHDEAELVPDGGAQPPAHIRARLRPAPRSRAGEPAGLGRVRRRRAAGSA